MASAVMMVAGAVIVASTATHLMGRASGSHLTSLGVAVAVAGIVLGLVTLLVFRFTRAGRPRRGRRAGHRRRAGSARPGRERRRVLDPTSVYSPGGLIDVPRDAGTPGSPGAARSAGFDTSQGPTMPQGSGGAREAFRPSAAGGASRATAPGAAHRAPPAASQGAPSGAPRGGPGEA
ncbi:MAG TPA: hypothetical protein VKU77_11540, partial [Streptosporangiaceae bacterium]|nr:hypothetical protein [Streptosporangiaceae bacterium]